MLGRRHPFAVGRRLAGTPLYPVRDRITGKTLGFVERYTDGQWIACQRSREAIPGARMFASREDAARRVFGEAS